MLLLFLTPALTYPETPRFFYPVACLTSLFACVVGFSYLAKTELLILHHHFLSSLPSLTEWHYHSPATDTFCFSLPGLL